MTDLEKNILQKLMERMDISAEDFAFPIDERTPLFGMGTPEHPSLGLDSIDTLELDILLEEELGRNVPVEDIMELSTVSAIARYIEERRAASPEGKT